jgi:hypothetical protein
MEAGGDADRFWRLTPRETQREFKAMATRARREQIERAWAVWHTAALPRLKKFPEFRKFAGLDPDKPAQTWQEQLAIAQRWAAAVKRI